MDKLTQDELKSKTVGCQTGDDHVIQEIPDEVNLFEIDYDL